MSIASNGDENTEMVGFCCSACQCDLPITTDNEVVYVIQDANYVGMPLCVACACDDNTWKEYHINNVCAMDAMLNTSAAVPTTERSFKCHECDAHTRIMVADLLDDHMWTPICQEHSVEYSKTHYAQFITINDSLTRDLNPNTPN
jgi:hypothetical protein